MSRRDLRASLAAACMPLPAAFLSLALMRMHGVGISPCALQIGALALGFAAVALLARAAPERVVQAIPGAALASLALTTITLVVPGIDQVHRWLPVGPLRLHASELLAPLVLLGVASLSAKHPFQAFALLLAFQGLHVAQPDAGQATAFATGALALSQALPLPRKTDSTARRWAPILGALVAMGLAAAAWKRPDPLPAVPHVEGIVDLAAQHGPLLKTAALAFLTLALCPALVVVVRAWRSPPARTAGVVLTAYFLATGAVPWLGNYPVPILGFGASPILGTYLALALLGSIASFHAREQDFGGPSQSGHPVSSRHLAGTRSALPRLETEHDTSTNADMESAAPPSSTPVVMPIEDSIDLHHFSPRDIPSVLDEYLHEAQKEGFLGVRVIHGKGKGVQRRRAHLLMQSHPAVESFRSDGLGSTLARLKAPTTGQVQGERKP